ncbi:hypothetical protein Slala03_10060 [Streptomyces lavendulae subsp. lavendulae]|nr:hypothetical protein Slala03_10060 [Streptomyces lavendulae subsp. lavendulae]
MTDEVTGGTRSCGAEPRTDFGVGPGRGSGARPGLGVAGAEPGAGDAAGEALRLVLVCDEAGRPRGSGFVADDRGTVITSHAAVDGPGRLVLHAPEGRSWPAGPQDVTPLPDLGLALVRTDGLGLRPLPVAACEEIPPGTYVRLPARGWRQARVLAAGAEVTYTAAGRAHLLPATVELAIGTDGRDALRRGAETCGGPVLDAETGAVLAVLGTALGTEHRSGNFAVPLRACAAAAPGGPLAALLERNSATVPGYGADLNLAGVLELTATALGSAFPPALGTTPGPDAAAEPVPRPAVAAGLAAFTTGERPVLGLVGAPGTGRTTALAALAADRARGPLPAPTLWLRGADLRGGDASLADAVTRALETAGRIVTAGGAGPVPPGTAERVAGLAAAAGRALLVVLDTPEEMPPQLAHRLAPWTGATAGWLRGTGARLVVAARPEYWEGAGELYPPGMLHTPDRAARRLPPALPVGDLTPDEARTARARLRIPDDAVREADARHPLTLSLLAGIRDAGVTAGRPGRDEVFAAHLDLVALRVAVRIAVADSGWPPGIPNPPGPRSHSGPDTPPGATRTPHSAPTHHPHTPGDTAPDGWPAGGADLGGGYASGPDSGDARAGGADAGAWHAGGTGPGGGYAGGADPGVWSVGGTGLGGGYPDGPFSGGAQAGGADSGGWYAGGADLSGAQAGGTGLGGGCFGDSDPDGAYARSAGFGGGYAGGANSGGAQVGGTDFGAGCFDGPDPADGTRGGAPGFAGAQGPGPGSAGGPAGGVRSDGERIVRGPTPDGGIPRPRTAGAGDGLGPAGYGTWPAGTRTTGAHRAGARPGPDPAWPGAPWADGRASGPTGVDDCDSGRPWVDGGDAGRSGADGRGAGRPWGDGRGPGRPGAEGRDPGPAGVDGCLPSGPWAEGRERGPAGADGCDSGRLGAEGRGLGGTWAPGPAEAQGRGAGASWADGRGAGPSGADGSGPGGPGAEVRDAGPSGAERRGAGRPWGDGRGPEEPVADGRASGPAGAGGRGAGISGAGSRGVDGAWDGGRDPGPAGAEGRDAGRPGTQGWASGPVGAGSRGVDGAWDGGRDSGREGAAGRDSGPGAEGRASGSAGAGGRGAGGAWDGGRDPGPAGAEGRGAGRPGAQGRAPGTAGAGGDGAGRAGGAGWEPGPLGGGVGVVYGPGVRRLAARVAGRVHEAARRCLGPGQGQLDRASFEELFPWRTGWASAVLTEGLLVPAGPGYRFAHEELSDWLQAAHLDVPTALDALVHHGPATPGPPVPRHRIGPVLEALRRLPTAETRSVLTRLVGALNTFTEQLAELDGPVHPDRVWWAARLLRGTLLGAPDAAPHLPVLHALAEHVARAGPGEFGGWFWNRLRLPESDRLDLLRRLLPSDHHYLEAAARRLVRAPRLVLPLVCAWFTDERRLRGRPGATVATAAQALLHTHRALAVDDLTEALVGAGHPRADELLAVLAEDEPSALSRAVERWAGDERPGRRVAAAAYGLATAPHVRSTADRELLRHAAQALLARPGDAPLHGSALAVLLRDPQVRARYLPDALDCFRDPGSGARLPASALVAALPVLPDPDAVFAALRARADGEVLRALAALTTPGLARRAGDLVRDHLAAHPEDAPHAAAFVDRRLEQGPAAGPVLRALVLDLLRTAPSAVRSELARVLAAPGGEPSRTLRGELADVLLREEADPAVLGAFLEALAAAAPVRPEERTRELLRRTGRRLLRAPGGPVVFEHRTVELARADPAFGALVARWLTDAEADAAALLGPGARRTVETLSRAAPDVT